MPLADFGTIQFTNATAVKDGRTVSVADAGGSAITMLNGSSQPLAVPSGIGSDGSSFSVARTSAPATPTAAGGRRPRIAS